MALQVNVGLTSLQGAKVSALESGSAVSAPVSSHLSCMRCAARLPYPALRAATVCVHSAEALARPQPHSAPLAGPCAQLFEGNVVISGTDNGGDFALMVGGWVGRLASGVRGKK